MSVSVSMPQLGESVTEGTVTRWLKKEGERVEVDEPLLEVSTDKVDTEIPSPASGILRGIAVDEDETVAVGAQLAIIEDSESGDSAPAADDSASADAAGAEPQAPEQPEAAQPEPAPAASSDGWGSQPNYAPPAQSASPASSGFSGSSAPSAPAYAPPPAYGQPNPVTQAAPAYGQPAPSAPYGQPDRPAPSAPYGQAAPPAGPTPASQVPAQGQPAPLAAPAPASQVPAQGQPAPDEWAPDESAPSSAAADAPAEEYPPPTPLPSGGDAPYVTPLVRKLAAEHAVNLETVTGTGVGGRIRKQDVIDAARALRGPGAVAATGQPGQSPAAQAPSSAAPPVTAAAAPAAAVQPQAAAAAAPVQPLGQEADQAAFARPVIVPSSLRGTTEHMSRARQLIAKRMVESLQTSAQLTTVVEADVTAIARLRDRAKADFEAREGVKLSFLPFFALAAVEALKVHPRLNAVIDTASAQVTYHDAEHLGIAVDTDRGLMVPVIRKAGDLNIAGLARKIADLAQRTRAGRVSPDDLSGGTFTLTNTGSRGALFDTPIINQPQVGILGVGSVVKRAVVVEDPALGEVIAVRSMVYLALTYDHRLVDGADAARFLVTMKTRLEEGAFETELGL